MNRFLFERAKKKNLTKYLLDHEKKIKKMSNRSISYILLKLFPTRSRLLSTPKKEAFENIKGKGVNDGKKHFF